MNDRDQAELIRLRDKLWTQIHGVPGLVTIGIGSKDGEAALVLFVDEKKVRKADLPVRFAAVPIIVESSGQIRPHVAKR